MKRREFMIGASSAASLIYFDRLHGATPCPPDLSGGNNEPVTCPAPQGTRDLAADASQIGPGEWLFSINLPSNIGRYDISWQNRTAFWDSVHRELQFMGKAQSGGSGKHWIYSEVNKQWRQTSGDVAPDKLGHVWIVTFDHFDDAGDYYFVEQDVAGSGEQDIRNTIRRMDRSLEDGQGSTNSPWNLLNRAGFQIWSTSDTPNPGMGYHPNLLGPGKPGIFCWGTVGFAWWNKLNDEWTEGANFSLSNVYGDRNGNTSLYVPGKDILFFGCSKNGTQQGMIIPAGYNGDPTPQLEDLPIRVQSSTTANTAHMLLDPRDDAVIMLLERDGDRVWTNSEGGLASAWVLESFTHPFWRNLPRSENDAGSWTPCSISSYGVILGMASNGSAANDGVDGTIMWRPG